MKSMKLSKLRESAENGRIGYVLAWLMGVPASVLLIIFLVRGH